MKYGRNVGTIKEKSPKQKQTGDKDLTINLPKIPYYTGCPQIKINLKLIRLIFLIDCGISLKSSNPGLGSIMSVVACQLE